MATVEVRAVETRSVGQDDEAGVGTTDTDLRYDDTQEALRASVRGLLDARSPWTRVLARTDTAEPYDRELWHALAAGLGLAGLAVPEDRGGAGATFREVAVVLEELGRAVAPVPYLGSAVVATRALLACGETELLGQLATGTASAALAVPFSSAPPPTLGDPTLGDPGLGDPTLGEGGLGDRGLGPVQAAVVADGDLLTGRVTSVADALPVDTLLVPTTTGLYVVDATGPGVIRTPVVSLDTTRQLCDITLTGAAGRRIVAADRTGPVLAAALTTGAALLASEQLGVAQWCLDTTVAYVRTRRQFGRAVGSFQAVKHRLADLWVAVAQARAVARYAAAWAGVDDSRAAVAAALAQAHCGPIAVLAAEECVQLHGGIGFTWEHPAHMYLKRAKSASLAFGSADRHRAALAELIRLPPAEPVPVRPTGIASVDGTNQVGNRPVTGALTVDAGNVHS